MTRALPQLAEHWSHSSRRLQVETERQRGGGSEGNHGEAVLWEGERKTSAFFTNLLSASLAMHTFVRPGHCTGLLLAAGRQPFQGKTQNLIHTLYS